MLCILTTEGLGSESSRNCYWSQEYAGHYWNPVDFMSYSLVNFVTFLVLIVRTCHVSYIVVLNKLTLTQPKCISGRCVVTFLSQIPNIIDWCVVKRGF